MLFQSVVALLLLLTSADCDFNDTETVLQAPVPRDLRTLTIVSGVADSLFFAIIIVLLRILYSLQASSRATTTVIRHTEDIV